MADFLFPASPSRTVRREVHCCCGMTTILKEPLKRSGKNIHFTGRDSVKSNKLSEKSITL